VDGVAELDFEEGAFVCFEIHDWASGDGDGPQRPARAGKLRDTEEEGEEEETGLTGFTGLEEEETK